MRFEGCIVPLIDPRGRHCKISIADEIERIPLVDEAPSPLPLNLLPFLGDEVVYVLRPTEGMGCNCCTSWDAREGWGVRSINVHFGSFGGP